MFEKKHPKGKNNSVLKGQAIVEFAIVLPILLVVLVGVLEVGRYLFIVSAATNASRNAVRYASAVGRDDDYGLTKYNYCFGIRKAARDSAYLVPTSDITVSITYDDGNGNSIGTCSNYTEGAVDGGLTDLIKTGDRVTVTVDVQYRPMVNLVPIKPQLIESETSRTILGIIDIKN